MAIKKQVIVFSIVYRDDETHGESAAAAIDHRLFNEDGVLEWDYRVKSEESLTSDIMDEEMEDNE
jgi:hypothetical protein